MKSKRSLNVIPQTAGVLNMPGLLDFMDSDEGRMGIGLLMAGSRRKDGAGFGQRLGEVAQYMQANQDNDAKRKIQQSQIDNFNSEIEARKLAGVKDARQQSLIESMFGGKPNAPSQPSMQGFAPDDETARPNPGIVDSGGGGPIAQGGRSGGQPSQGRSPNLMESARQYGIPEQAIKADMVFNGGKGISAMLAKQGTPDMQVTNGYAYDKNQLGPGFMPSLSTSTNGQTSMTQIGRDGMPEVSAPQGALSTFGAYKGMEAGLGAAAKVNLRENADGTKTPVSELTENPTLQNMLGGASGMPANATAPGSFQQANPTRRNLLAAMPGESDKQGIYGRALQEAQQQFAQARTPEEKARAQSDIAGIQGELGIRTPQSPAGPVQYGMTNDQAATAEANRAGLVDTAKAGVVRDTAGQTKTRNAGETINSVDRAITLLGQKPTASAVGVLADKTAGMFGVSTNGANVAAQLDVVAADIVKNVPRFEGPQSDKDVDQYKSAAGRVADRSLPIEQRMAAAQEVKLLQARAALAANKAAAKTVVKTGMYGGKRVVQYSDGSTDYAN